MAELQLLEATHPDRMAKQHFDALVGLDAHKQRLIDGLVLVMAHNRLETWVHRHHPKGLLLVETFRSASPLVLLAGEVGCGKTALATTIGTPLAHELKEKVLVLETPSNIRGTGMVGELSARVTDAFTQARAKVGKGAGLLIIDEADDLGLSRSERQAHHEDRAGLNVLIKQIDLLVREKTRMAVLMITNRARAMDPALLRRATLTLEFTRPGPVERRHLFERMLEGSHYKAQDVELLVSRSERPVLFSYSDLTQRVARTALLDSLRRDTPFGTESLLAALEIVEPSPLMEG
ncbi:MULTISPECIES: ATP-binding protein [unclassified Myxococcus]|uniref:ATP-binding protein n=1 Tax=unclassified Myxococcus TaxID=2648731 RepID=UPI00157A4AD0|nr:MULTISPECIES: ATP-binding protein [unclassified Myxococcus]NTX33988.1 ATP-binding protein [Myxococcus sp. CA033]NTX54905.1 ATP-binding protein [Myxococcus sp. CA039A]